MCKEIYFALKDGRPCTLRAPQPQDAAAMLDYIKRTSAETDFVGRYPQEITDTPAQEAKLLQQALESPRQAMLSAFVQGSLVANASLGPVNERIKTRHRAGLGIAVVRRAWGQGIGRQLILQLLRAGEAMGYEQVELETVADNQRAISLYQTLGFIPYGRYPKAFKLQNGSYADSLLMVRPYPSAPCASAPRAKE